MKRALVVIDVQKEYFDGALPITGRDASLGKICSAMDAAKAAGIPRIVVQHTMPTKDLPIFQRDSASWALHPEIASRGGELHIEKNLPGSFTGTQLEEYLRKQGVDTLVVSGYMTHMCCDTTAREAVHRGFKVEFLSDATGTLPLDNAGGKVTAEELQRSILAAQQHLLSEVVSTRDWLARVR